MIFLIEDILQNIIIETEPLDLTSLYLTNKLCKNILDNSKLYEILYNKYVGNNIKTYLVKDYWHDDHVLRADINLWLKNKNLHNFLQLYCTELSLKTGVKINLFVLSNFMKIRDIGYIIKIAGMLRYITDELLYTISTRQERGTTCTIDSFNYALRTDEEMQQTFDKYYITNSILSFSQLIKIINYSGCYNIKFNEEVINKFNQMLNYLLAEIKKYYLIVPYDIIIKNLFAGELSKHIINIKLL